MSELLSVLRIAPAWAAPVAGIVLIVLTVVALMQLTRWLNRAMFALTERVVEGGPSAPSVLEVPARGGV